MSDVEYAYHGVAGTIVSGPEEIDRLGVHMGSLGVRRAMVVCGPNILRSSDVIGRVERAAGARVVGRFSGVEPHSPVDVLRAALEVARQVKPDTVISVGGGSTVAIAKGLALLLSTEHELQDFETRFEPPDRVLAPRQPLPKVTTRVIAVPTTMGGAEIGHAVGAFADETRSRKIIVSADGRTSPCLIVIDGRALKTTPRSVQVGTSMGQMRCAIESYASTAHNPISDALALHSIRRLGQALQSGWPDDLHHILLIKGACTLASMAMTALGMGAGKLGVNSAIAHQVGAICEVAHGQANAILLPHTIVFNAQAVGERFRLIAQALNVVGATDRSIEALSVDVAQLMAGYSTALGVPARLRDVGVSADSFEQIVTATLGDRCIATNPVAITSREQIAQLLRAAW